MRATRPAILWTTLSIALGYSASGCGLDADEDEEDTESAEVQISQAVAKEGTLPAYGVHFAVFPQVSHPVTDVNEYENIRSHHVPYARVNFVFVPGTDYSRQSLRNQYDADMTKAAQQGVHILPTIMPLIPCTAVDGNCVADVRVLTDEDLQDLMEFAEKLAKSYGPRSHFWKGKSRGKPVRIWEIGNEPNSTLKNFFVGTPRDYKRILQAARKGLRRGDPRARILLGGLYPFLDHDATPPGEFLNRVFAGGAGRCLVDAVAYHPYAGTPDGAVAKTKDVVGAINKHVVGSRRERDVQLWITEIGRAVNPNDPNPPASPGPWVANDKQQKAYIKQFAEKLEDFRHEWRLASTFWYSYVDATGYTSWAGFAGVSERTGTWEAIGEIGDRAPVMLPPVHRCPSRGSH